MTIQLVDTVRVRPERLREFTENVAELASTAGDAEEKWHWAAYEVMFGGAPVIYFVTLCETFAEVEKLGIVEELWRRVAGDKKGFERFLAAAACLESREPTIAMLRPELSYMTGPINHETHPYAAVVGARARPGHADALEELVRKVAEAIPKVDDPARISTWQSYFGDMGSYFTVRPLTWISDIDGQLLTPTLLDHAFGAAEGGLIWRTGMDAIQEARRELVRYVPELSHAPIE